MKDWNQAYLVLFVVIGGRLKMLMHHTVNPVLACDFTILSLDRDRVWAFPVFHKSGTCQNPFTIVLHGLHILYTVCFSTETSGQRSSMLDAARSVHPGSGAGSSVD